MIESLKSKKGAMAISQITILLVATFAFCFLISGEFAGAEEVTTYYRDNSKNLFARAPGGVVYKFENNAWTRTEMQATTLNTYSQVYDLRDISKLDLNTPGPDVTTPTEVNTPTLSSPPTKVEAPAQTLPSGKKEYSTLFGKMEASPFWGNTLEGLSWASAILGLTATLGGFMSGETGKNVQQGGLAISAGLLAGKTVYGLMGGESAAAKWTGIGVGIIVTYWLAASSIEETKEREETIEFKCMTWTAPLGGANCEKCNTDPLRPCSEYRCKALGQTCKLINAGTGNEMCIDSGRDDVTSPGIKPDRDAIALSGYKYANVRERPPGGQGPAGMTIVNPESAEGCLKAFTSFTFGIITTDISGNQPGQCKVDYNHTAKMDDMGYWMGDNNLFVEKHNETISLPGTYNLNQTFPGVGNDGDYNLYIRCRDGNGNENRDEFVVSFCIDKTPDLSAPVIKTTSIASGSPVLYKVDNLSVNVYTNEPAKCKWSRKDSAYSNMENNMSCSNNVWEMNAQMLYTCTAALTGIKDREANSFFFRCEDMMTPSNVMQQSYPFTLIGTQPLTLLSVGPTGTVSSSTSTASVNLTARTDNGFRNGEATCYYSPTGINGSYIDMIESGEVNSHKQPLDLAGGSYNYYIKCIDLGGNTASNTTSFTVYIDKFAPKIVRAYSLEGKLVVTTDEESNCRYSTESCNFDLSKGEGVDMPYSNSDIHYAEWIIEQNYYIKCSDKHDNAPEPSECSMIIRPYSLAEEEE